MAELQISIRQYIEGTCVIALDTDTASLPLLEEHGRGVRTYPYISNSVDDIRTVPSSGNHICLTLTAISDLSDIEPLIPSSSGIIYTHAVATEAKLNVMAVPIGALIFKCDPIQRDKLLHHSKIDNTWFNKTDKERYMGVVPVYFPIEIQTGLMKAILVDNNDRLTITDHLRVALRRCLTQKHHEESIAYASIMSQIVFPLNQNYWFGHLRELAGIYLQHRGEHDIAVIDESTGKRTLSTTEYLALLFKIEFFHNKGTGLDKYQTCGAVNSIRLPVTHEERTVINSYGAATMDVAAYLTQLRTCSVVNENNHLIYPKNKLNMRDQSILKKLMSLEGDRLRLDEAEREYDRFKHLYYTNLQVMRPLFDAYTTARKSLYHSTIAVNFKLANIMEDAGCDAPQSMFVPTQEVEAWRDKELKVVDGLLSKEKFLHTIFMNAKSITRDVQTFRVYGYTDHLDNRVLNEQEYTGRGMTPPVDKQGVGRAHYTASRVKTLTNCDWVTTKMIPCVASAATRVELKTAECAFAHTNDRLTPTGKALTYAGIGGFPILADWGQQTGTAHKPSSFIRIAKNDSTAESNSNGTMLEEILQNVLSLPNGMCHEVIHSELDITTLVIDIDIKSGCTYTRDDAIVLAKDAVSLMEALATTVLPKECTLTHYVFWSESEKPTTKLGLHHHVRLSDGYALTHMVAGELIKIMAELRFLYPDTLGVFCGTGNEDVYDPNIYKVKETGFTSHSLRLPGHCKPDGSKRLICIHRTDDKPLTDTIPWRVCYAHSPHERSTGGTLITKIVGVTHVNNMDYLEAKQTQLLNTFIRAHHNHSVRGVMHAINVLTYMFNIDEFEEPTDCEIRFLLHIVEKLWYGVGIQKMRSALEDTRGDNQKRYSRQQITTALQNTKIVVIRDELHVCGSNGTTFPLCPIRVHNTPHSDGVDIGISMKPGGVVLAFRVVTVFKSSCRGQFIFSVDLTPGYISQHLRKWFEDHLLARFNYHRNIQQWSASFQYSKFGNVDIQLMVYQQAVVDNLPSMDDIEKIYILLPTENVVVFNTTRNIFFMISFDDTVMLVFKTVGAKLFFGGLSNDQFRPHLANHLLDRLERSFKNDGYDL